MTRTVLIAGYGAFGALHARAWGGIQGIAVQVADASDMARRRAIEDGFQDAAVFESVEAALDRADIVDIVTPPDTHLPVALRALDRGRQVLIEKPATRSLSDALRLAHAAGDMPVQVGLILRAHPLTRRARQLLKQGAIGRLLSMRGEFSGWKRMRADSSLLENDGVHFLDLMRHVTQSPVVAVDATARALLGGKVADDIRVETRHENGVSGELHLGVLHGGTVADSVVPGAVTRKAMTLCGDRGILHLDFNRNQLAHGQVRYVPAPGGWHPEPGPVAVEDMPETSTVDLLRDTFRTYLDAWERGTPPLCDLTEGAVELAAICEAINAAITRERPPFVPVVQSREAVA